MDAGLLDNGLLDKRTISIESIIAPTRFIASIVLEIIVGVRTLDKRDWTLEKGPPPSTTLRLPLSF